MVIIGLLKYLESCVKAMDKENIDVMRFTALQQIERIEKQLSIYDVVLQSEQLCQYDKMCVRKRLNNGCPSNCKDDTRK